MPNSPASSQAVPRTVLLPMSGEAWQAKYRPIAKLETFGEEYRRVREACKANPANIWTVISSDDGELYVTNGFHFVNRLLYIVTEVPCEENTIVEAEYWDVA